MVASALRSYVTDVRVDELAALETGCGTIGMPTVGVFRLSGPDAPAALHRIVTQDVESLASGQGRLALLLAPKGQFRAVMGLFRLGEDLLVVSPPDRAGDLAQGLERFLALSRCALEPVPGHVIGVFGPRWREAVTALDVDPAPIAGGGGLGEPVRSAVWLAATVTGVSGAFALFASEVRAAAAQAELEAGGAVPLSPGSLEVARIVAGFPAWGAELTDDVLPPEVGLERIAVSDRKGCYIGQETMARIATYGHVNRALVAVREEAPAGLPPPLPLPVAPPEDGAAKGKLTSWARHPTRGGVGLALVRRTAAVVGNLLQGQERRFVVERLVAG